MEYTEEIVQVSKKDIPKDLWKAIKRYIKVSKKARIAFARTKNYNAKHPENKKDTVTKWHREAGELHRKIDCEWLNHFFPKVGGEVFYYVEKDDKLRKGKLIWASDRDWRIKIKAANNNVISRTKDIVYYKGQLYYTNIGQMMRNA